MKKKHLQYIVMLTKYSLFSFLLQTVLMNVLIAHEGTTQPIQPTRSIKEIRLDMKFNNANLQEVFHYIEAKTGLSFIFDENKLQIQEKFNFNEKNTTVEDILIKVSSQAGLSFRQVNRSISVYKNSNKQKKNEPAIEIIIQTKAVSGKITDENGQGLPGVNILEKGTLNGTVTDINGSFKINVAENATLVFSSVGYTTEEVSVGNRSFIEINMSPDIKQLQELVVVGYGVQKKADVTGSVTSISSKEITEYQRTNIDQLLQGRLAGVQVSSKGGKPGANMSIQIRGINSPNGNEPLYVIDGIPVGNGGGADYNSRTLNELNNNTHLFAKFDLSSLNPNDIATIDVLKDASATAIYGSRAANGVVVITTKRGQKGEAKINFDAYYGTQQLTKQVDMLGSKDYLELMQESRVNGGQSRVALYDQLLNSGNYYNTNWQDEVYHVAPMANYNLTLSGGADKLTYFLSGGYNKQDGILGEDATDFEKYSIRLNLDNEIKDWLKIGFNVNGSKTKSNLSEQLNNYSPPYDALANLPFLPVRWNDGDNIFGDGIIIGGYSGPTNTVGNDELNRNPIAEANEFDRIVEKNMIIGNFQADVNLFKGLKYTASVGGTYNNGYYHNWMPVVQFGTRTNSNVNKLQTGRTSGYQTQFDQYFTYNWGNNIHDLTAMVGHSDTKDYWSTLTAERDNFLFDTRALVGGAATNQAGDGSIWETTLQSFFGRINYSLQDKYLLTATIRRDGSSKFSYNNKYANFPSVALGWKVTNEDFMAGVTFIDALKVRASWGQTGAQNIGDFAYIARIAMKSQTAFGENNGLIPAAIHDNLPNDNVKWETTTQTNIGFDAGFLKNRLNVSFDWYNKTTDDLLLGSLPLPEYLGIGGPTVNLGTFENQGIELQLDMKNILNTSDFIWDAGVNFSRNRNEVINIGGFDQAFGSGGYINTSHGRTYVGHPWAMFYGHIVESMFQNANEISNLDAKAIEQATTNGISNPQNVRYQINNPQPGDIKFKDLNTTNADGSVTYGVPDGRVDDNDRTFIGNPHPDFIFGLNTRLSYKGFDLSIFGNGSYGNDIFNQSRQDFERFGGAYRNQTAAALNRWRSEAQPGDGLTPRAVWNDVNRNNRDSDRFIEDGSYFRIKNITLGYNLPKNLLSKASISNVRVYVSLNDYFTFSKYSWYNPDLGYLNNNVYAPGVDFSTYPNAKTTLIGINVNL